MRSNSKVHLNPVVVLLRIFNYNLVKVVMDIFMPSETVSDRLI